MRGTITRTDRWPAGAGAWSADQPRSIYRFSITAAPQGLLAPGCCRATKGRRGRGCSSPASLMRRRRSIAERPAEALDRSVPGHLEADLMAFSRSGQFVLVTHDRCTRRITLERLPDKTSATVRRKLSAQLASLPRSLRRSLTFDNGTEFALHAKPKKGSKLELGTFFCIPMPLGKRAPSSRHRPGQATAAAKTNLGDTLTGDQLRRELVEPTTPPARNLHRPSDPHKGEDPKSAKSGPPR
ncbi:MAG: IS30 family transposase [Devosia sp.]|nr:IS30 family transposase [Devosia sp.]